MNYGRSPAQAPPEPEHHVCLSGKLWCSGIMPCLECFYTQRDIVMPSVIVESGVNGAAMIMLYDLLEALRQRGIDPAKHLGVRIDYTKLDPNEQVRTALTAFEHAMFHTLQDRLATDPALRARVRTNAIASPLPVRYPAQAEPQYPYSAPQQSPSAYAPSPAQAYAAPQPHPQAFMPPQGFGPPQPQSQGFGHPQGFRSPQPQPQGYGQPQPQAFRPQSQPQAFGPMQQPQGYGPPQPQPEPQGYGPPQPQPQPEPQGYGPPQPQPQPSHASQGYGFGGMFSPPQFFDVPQPEPSQAEAAEGAVREIAQPDPKISTGDPFSMLGLGGNGTSRPVTLGSIFGTPMPSATEMFAAPPPPKQAEIAAAMAKVMPEPAALASQPDVPLERLEPRNMKPLEVEEIVLAAVPVEEDSESSSSDHVENGVSS